MSEKRISEKIIYANRLRIRIVSLQRIIFHKIRIFKIKKMKKEQLVFGGLGLLVIAILVYYLNEKRKREKALIEEKDKENKALRNVIDGLTNEVNEIIDSKNELTGSTKEQLKSLIQEYKDIDEKVAEELISINALIEIKEETRAVFGLAKIIENLLKRIYKGDVELKKNPRFVDLINHAKEKKLLKNEECHFLNGIRAIRNEEAHDLAIKKSRNIIETSMLVGITIIFKLSSTIKAIS